MDLSPGLTQTDSILGLGENLGRASEKRLSSVRDPDTVPGQDHVAGRGRAKPRG